MKKLIYSAASLLMLGFGSCSQDDLKMPENGGNVVITVQLDVDHSTRAASTFGNGLSATNLRYAVYNGTGKYATLLNTAKVQFPANSTTLELPLELAVGQTYNIVFFAYNKENDYKFNAETVYDEDGFDVIVPAGSVTFNYSEMNSTSTPYDNDCFFGNTEINVGKDSSSPTVLLYRPVAQVNWGTSDMSNPYVMKLYNITANEDGTLSTGNVRSRMTCKAYNNLDLFTGVAGGELVDAIVKNPFKMIPGDYPVPGGYEYLNCSYVLASKEGDVVDCTLDLYWSTTLKQTVSVPQVPLQRNFRTNIYGKLLTETTGFTVTKEAMFGGSSDVWDGSASAMPVPDENGVYTVMSAPELKAIANYVNSGNTMAGKTIKLGSNIDLQNINWTPIGNETTTFNGSFDGGGYTISNLKIDMSGKPGQPAGLFGRVWNNASTFENVNINNVNINVIGNTPSGFSPVGSLIGTANVKYIKGVNVSNVTINSYRQSGGVVGGIYGIIEQCTANDVNITLQFEKKGDKYDNCDKAGGIAGIHFESNNMITGNKVSNVTITGYRGLGGLFGQISEGTYSNNTANDVTIYVTLAHADQYIDDSQAENYGPIVGNPAKSVDGDGNTYTGYTLHEPTKDVTNLADLNAAIAKGGYIGIAPNVTITVPANVSIDQPTMINIPEGSTIDMGGYQVTNNSELELSGSGTVTGNNRVNVIQNQYGATMTIYGGKYVNSNPSESGSNPNVLHNVGKMIIEDGLFITGRGSAVNANNTFPQTETPTELIINGGQFLNTISGQYVINMNGNINATINGGTFMGYFGCILTHSSKGERPENITHLSINGGTFISYGEGNTYHAVCLDPENNNLGSEVTINGGKFWSNTSTLSCKKGSTLILKGGMYRSLNNCPVAPGYSTFPINVSETVSIESVSVNANYTIQIK